MEIAGAIFHFFSNSCMKLKILDIMLECELWKSFIYIRRL